MADFETERAIVQRTADQIERLAETALDTAAGLPMSTRRELDDALRVYAGQVTSFRALYPGTIEARAFESSLYGYQALTKFHAVGLARSASRVVASGTSKVLEGGKGGGLLGLSVRLSAAVVGGAVSAGAAMAAKKFERANAQEALELLDRAIAVLDTPGARFSKARIFLALGQRDDAVRELDEIITKFPADDLYPSARHMRDEIAATKKTKSWF